MEQQRHSATDRFEQTGRFSDPAEVLRSSLTRDEKITILRSWHDEALTSVIGSDRSGDSSAAEFRLGQVIDALRQLRAEAGYR